MKKDHWYFIGGGLETHDVTDLDKLLTLFDRKSFAVNVKPRWSFQEPELYKYTKEGQLFEKLA